MDKLTLNLINFTNLRVSDRKPTIKTCRYRCYVVKLFLGKLIYITSYKHHWVFASNHQRSGLLTN